jgi:hypothetical protein
LAGYRQRRINDILIIPKKKPSTRALNRKFKTITITVGDKTKLVDILGFDDVEEIYLPEDWDSLTHVFEHFYHKSHRSLLDIEA